MSVSLLQVPAAAAAAGVGEPSVRITAGYNITLDWANDTPAPTLAGILVADISHLLPYFGTADTPPQFPPPAASFKVGNVICGYTLAHEDGGASRPFPATGTLFLYLSANNSTLQDAGALIVATIPFSSLAELINDLDNITPSDFINSAYGSVPATTTSLRLMAYYSAPTEPAWSVQLVLGITGVQKLNAILSIPPP